MSEISEIVGNTLIALGQTILKNGMPKEPVILQGEPQRDYGFFVAVWPNTGERTEESFILKKR